ncbi:glycerol acyltransferase, partial [Kitasatospora sp. RB6PN24]|nr:glycerol acyltransferase [Kitasatospora humi]
MTAARDQQSSTEPGARVIPIEAAPSWTGSAGPDHGPGLADRLAGSLGSLLAGRTGAAADSLFGKGWEERAATGLGFL